MHIFLSSSFFVRVQQEQHDAEGNRHSQKVRRTNSGMESSTKAEYWFKRDKRKWIFLFPSQTTPGQVSRPLRQVRRERHNQHRKVEDVRYPALGSTFIRVSSSSLHSVDTPKMHSIPPFFFFFYRERRDQILALPRSVCFAVVLFVLTLNAGLSCQRNRFLFLGEHQMFNLMIRKAPKLSPSYNTDFPKLFVTCAHFKSLGKKQEGSWKAHCTAHQESHLHPLKQFAGFSVRVWTCQVEAQERVGTRFLVLPGHRPNGGYKSRKHIQDGDSIHRFLVLCSIILRAIKFM